MPHNTPGPLDLTGLQVRVSEYVADNTIGVFSGDRMLGFIRFENGVASLIPFVPVETGEELVGMANTLVLPRSMMRTIEESLKNAKGWMGTNDSISSE